MKVRPHPQSFLQKNLGSAEFTKNKHGKPTLEFLIANHELEMYVKLKFQLVRFEKKHVLLWWFLNSIKACSHNSTCIIKSFCTTVSC